MDDSTTIWSTKLATYGFSFQLRHTLLEKEEVKKMALTPGSVWISGPRLGEWVSG